MQANYMVNDVGSLILGDFGASQMGVWPGEGLPPDAVTKLYLGPECAGELPALPFSATAMQNKADMHRYGRIQLLS